jgi:hypothetical protein
MARSPARREATDRYERRLRARLRYARLRYQAAVADVDYRAARGLGRRLFQALIAGGDQAHNPIIKEPASQQKTGWLRKACLDGRYPLMRALGGVKLLILDDLVPSNRSGPEQRHDMLESYGEVTAYQRALRLRGRHQSERATDIIGIRTLMRVARKFSGC